MDMQTRTIAIAALTLACGACLPLFAQDIDPTVPHEAMAERLRSQVADSDALALHALVIGADGDGVALVGTSPAAARAVRRGSVIPVEVDGVRVDVEMKSVTADGVELAATASGRSVFLPGAHKPLPPPAQTNQVEFLRYLECSGVPVDRLMRLLSEQAGVNIATSEAASEKTVSIFLRNVSADVAVEEICRAAGLWFHRDRTRGVIRVTTMDEFSDTLNCFREEATEMFTLHYPNVVEVASLIYGLYPDRTFLSLGEDEFNEDEEYDLSRRFRRFRVLEDNGGSQFLDMEPPQTSSSSSGSSSGTFSFSRGGAFNSMSQWEMLRRRSRIGRQWAGRTVGFDDLRTLQMAQTAGNTNMVDQIVAQATASAPNIFVTISRRNNAIVVRTSDPNVMDQVRRIIKEFDVPTPMVLMEVKVLELNVTDDYEAGFTWNLTSPDRGNGVSTHSVGHAGDGVRNVTANAIQTGMNAVNPTFQFGLVSDYIASQIELMQKDGKVRTLATPTLLVANNEVSRIFSGKEYPLVSGWTAGESVTSDGGIVTTPSTVQIEKKDVGTMLLLTPNINADKTVTIRLLQENSAVSPEKVDIPVTGSTTESGDVRSIEYVESRQITGTFVANDGMTVMAGGLIREQEEETYWRTPVLGSLPLLGWLFRGTEKAKVRTELVILIKPHVISTPVEGGRISRELMETLSAHPARDGRANMGVFIGEENRPHDLKDDVRNVTE